MNTVILHYREKRYGGFNSTKFKVETFADVPPAVIFWGRRTFARHMLSIDYYETTPERVTLKDKVSE